MQKIYELLYYYLIERCLKSDQYIYSEGVSVSIINFMKCIEHYFRIHTDSNGEEKELLHLEKVISKLTCLVKFMEVSCSVNVHETMSADRRLLNQNV